MTKFYRMKRSYCVRIKEHCSRVCSDDDSVRIATFPKSVIYLSLSPFYTYVKHQFRISISFPHILSNDSSVRFSGDGFFFQIKLHNLISTISARFCVFSVQSHNFSYTLFLIASIVPFPFSQYQLSSNISPRINARQWNIYCRC